MGDQCQGRHAIVAMRKLRTLVKASNASLDAGGVSPGRWNASIHELRLRRQLVSSGCPDESVESTFVS